MAVKGPTPAQMRTIAEDLGMSLTDGEVQFFIDQMADRIGKPAGRIGLGRRADGLDMQAPARAQAPQGVVELGPHAHQAGRRGAGQVGPAKLQRLLKGPILVEHHARRDQQRPGQVVTRDELFDEVWPDKAPSEVEAWEVNLRSIKADLVKRLKPALEGRKAPIEAVQGSAVDGGYRLTLQPERVCWWSDPVQ